MDSKLSRSFSRVAVSTSFLILSFLVNPAHAVNWQEVSDAGQLLGTAQEPLGDGPLRNIRGAVSTNADVDLYKIFISDPTIFSASVESATGNFDSVLALFNQGGFGVYGNDDARLGSSDAGYPLAASLARRPRAGTIWRYLVLTLRPQVAMAPLRTIILLPIRALLLHRF